MSVEGVNQYTTSEVLPFHLNQDALNLLHVTNTWDCITVVMSKLQSFIHQLMHSNYNVGAC